MSAVRQYLEAWALRALDAINGGYDLDAVTERQAAEQALAAHDAAEHARLFDRVLQQDDGA